MIDCHPVRGRGRSWSWEVVAQLSKALEGLEDDQASVCESSDLELSRATHGVMAVHLAAPGGWGGGYSAGPWAGLHRAVHASTHKGATASCPLGHHGCVQPTPSLGSRAKLSQESCGVVVTDMLATGPACTERCGCVCRMFLHCHSTVFTTACDNGGGRCGRRCGRGCTCMKPQR